MISFLTSLKPFPSAAPTIQDRALANWRRLEPSPEIVLYGDGAGVADRARRFGAVHVPDVRVNARGVPDFAAVAAHAARQARHDVQVYLNGDILLPPDFIHQVRRVRFARYLLVGQRIDLAETAEFDPVTPDWHAALRRCAAAGQAQVHAPTGMDYFVFPRGLWHELAPLIVGRGGYDNALIAYCLRRRIPIVDATWSIHVVHQWHDYAHLTGGKGQWGESDTLENRRRHDILHSTPDVEDADWRLVRGETVSCRSAPNPLRRLEVWLRYRRGWKYASYPCRVLTRLAWTVGRLRPRALSMAEVLGDGDTPAA